MIAKIFKAYDVRATYPDPLNEKQAWRVGYASGKFLQTQEGLPKKPAGKPPAKSTAKPVASTAAGLPTVLVSRDMRPSSPSLAAALIDGLMASGVNVIDLGMCDTSFIYFAINYLKAIGGIQTTASHNPVQYNGFKVSGREARPIGATTGLKEIERIAASLEGENPPVAQPSGTCQPMDLWDAYRKHVLKFLLPLPRKMTVFIDASNGMAGKMVPQVFSGVPNLEFVQCNFDITGSFVHEPNPLVAENMIPTQMGVRETRADLGACFDGDADRCMLTDEKGEIIGCDHLTALLCEHFLRQAPGAAVVYDLRSSKSVEEEIRRQGGKPVRSRVGHVFMKGLLRETQGIFGGELSGHFYFRDNFYADSGAIAFAAVLSVLSRAGKPMSELIAPFKKYPQSGEINFHTADKAKVMEQIKQKYAEAKVDELDGVTVDAWAAEGGANGGGFWFNVRASNTEPLLRLNAEARDQGTLDKLLKTIKPLLGKEEKGH